MDVDQVEKEEVVKVGEEGWLDCLFKKLLSLSFWSVIFILVCFLACYDFQAP